MPGRLVTIPISHFCEKARWALDRAGIAYDEERHVQVIHAFHTRRAGGGYTAPVFVSELGEVLAESSDVLRWADARLEPSRRLYPAGPDGVEAARVEAWLGEGLGPDGRVWLYWQSLPVVKELARWALDGVPRWERGAFRFSGPLVGVAIRRRFHIDAAASADALGRVERVFDEISARLADGRPFLLGDRFTAADLTFAALSAPLLLPERYGSPLPPPEAMPERAAGVVRELRAHPAGAFAERVYAEERGRAPAVVG